MLPNLPPDYHLHTPLCKHAVGAPTEYRTAAKDRGIEEICFTDHVPTPGTYDARHRMTLSEFPAYREMIAALRDDESPRVRFGIEADYYEGCEPFLREWLPAQDFDLVLGSVHYLDNWGFDNPAELARWSSVDIPSVWRNYFDHVVRLAKTRLFDVVGHFDLPKKFGHRLPETALKAAVLPALDAVAAAGMGIEINTSGYRRPAQEQYPTVLILSLARERHIPICFGSDAHRPEEVGHEFEKAVAVARAAGYTQTARFNRRLPDLIPL